MNPLAAFVHRLLDFVIITRLRREAHPIDVYEERRGDCTIFWPVSPRAQEIFPDAFREFKKWSNSGFVVDNSQWKEVHDALHHDLGLSLIGMKTCFGLVVDTP